MRLGYNGSPALRTPGGTRVEHGFGGHEGSSRIGGQGLGDGERSRDPLGGRAAPSAPEGPAGYSPLPAVRPTDRRAGSVVYVLQGEAFPYFKIGSSSDLRARWSTLRCSTPGGLRCVAWWRVSSGDLRAAEIDLQARLARWLVNGEWFKADEASTALIVGWRDGGRPTPTTLFRGRWSPNWKKRRAWLSVFYAWRREGCSAREAFCRAEAQCA
jgi:hypothetical protein